MEIMKTEQRIIYGHSMSGRNHARRPSGAAYCGSNVRKFTVIEGEWEDVTCQPCKDRLAKQRRISKIERAKVPDAKEVKQVLQKERGILDEIPWSESVASLGSRLARQGGRAE